MDSPVKARISLEDLKALHHAAADSAWASAAHHGTAHHGTDPIPLTEAALACEIDDPARDSDPTFKLKDGDCAQGLRMAPPGPADPGVALETLVQWFPFLPGLLRASSEAGHGLYVAGGAVARALVSSSLKVREATMLPEDPSLEDCQLSIESLDGAVEAGDTDLDLFFVTSSVEEASVALDHAVNMVIGWAQDSDVDVSVVEGGALTLTVISGTLLQNRRPPARYKARKIQFVLRVYPSRESILYGFDLVSSQFGVRWDGARLALETTYLGLFSLRTWTILDLGRTSPSYLGRIAKYMRLGFRLRLPDLRRDFLRDGGPMQGGERLSLTVGNNVLTFRDWNCAGNVFTVYYSWSTPKSRLTSLIPTEDDYGGRYYTDAYLNFSVLALHNYLQSDGRTLSRGAWGRIRGPDRQTTSIPDGVPLETAPSRLTFLRRIPSGAVQEKLLYRLSRIAEQARNCTVSDLTRLLGLPVGSPQMLAVQLALLEPSPELTPRQRISLIYLPVSNKIRETDSVPFQWWYQGHPSLQGRGTRNFIPLGPLGILGYFHRDCKIPLADVFADPNYRTDGDYRVRPAAPTAAPQAAPQEARCPKRRREL